jgi:hypothetical protein
MRPVHGHNLGARLCELFELDADKVDSINILCHVNDYVRVEVTYLAVDVELQEIVDEIREYRLVEKE